MPSKRSHGRILKKVDDGYVDPVSPQIDRKLSEKHRAPSDFKEVLASPDIFEREHPLPSIADGPLSARRRGSAKARSHGLCAMTTTFVAVVFVDGSHNRIHCTQVGRDTQRPVVTKGMRVLLLALGRVCVCFGPPETAGTFIELPL
jgi:hypothetical protein